MEQTSLHCWQLSCRPMPAPGDAAGHCATCHITDLITQIQSFQVHSCHIQQPPGRLQYGKGETVS